MLSGKGYPDASHQSLVGRGQPLVHFDLIHGEQGTESMFHGFLQFLLATQVTLCGQDRGVTEKKLDSL
jgi:hypothetical protein